MRGKHNQLPTGSADEQRVNFLKLNQKESSKHLHKDAGQKAGIHLISQEGMSHHSWGSCEQGARGHQTTDPPVNLGIDTLLLQKKSGLGFFLYLRMTRGKAQSV